MDDSRRNEAAASRALTIRWEDLRDVLYEVEASTHPSPQSTRRRAGLPEKLLGNTGQLPEPG
ncbi:hypothetical protein WME97_17480 [Sorangium sp. So ce367]|uniref:hypothetical protein n=1 Tax=Sorangium sp. So ce367 TaxID=3133305 RepID=UPI003F5F1263